MAPSIGSTHTNGSKDVSASSSDGNISNVAKIKTAGDGGEFIIIGNQMYYRHELMAAFGGSLNPGLAPYPVNQFGNPAPLGLSAFALTTFVLSMYNARAMGITTPNVVVGLACFYGGAVQFLAGVYEIASANTFGGTALTSYGAFWLSYAAINIKSFGIAAAYGDDTHQLHTAVAFYLLGWGLFTFMLTLCTLKSTLSFCSLFASLTITFLLLSAGDFTGKLGVTRAGGVFGVITAFLGFYNAFAGVATKSNSYITVHPFYLTKQNKIE